MDRLYFPYLRGKQYELLALKELSPVLGQQQKTLPIIEPVRSPVGSGLGRCITALQEDSIDFILIANPGVGNLKSRLTSADLASYITDQDQASAWNIGLLIDETTELESLIGDYGAKLGTKRSLSLIHKGLATDIHQAVDLTAEFPRQFDVIDERWRRRYFSTLLQTSNGVTLRDGFPGEERNSDYLPKEGSVFTDDHLFFKDEGWYGFSDYLTIGEKYADGGFTPRAVAIHWTYEAVSGGPIMIRHFTSESNGDISNIGGKFLQAANKLVIFLNQNDIHTRAAEAIRAYVADSTYPGLGILKKLSVQNHLELVSGILSRQ